MARVKTLRERVQEIVRKYKHVSDKKFFYNKPGELRGRYKRIRVWYLIHDEQRGYSVMKMEWKRANPMSVATWTTLHAERVGKYEALYNVFTQAVLPAINNKGGNKWRFISLIGWAGLRDNRPAKDTTAPRRRNKTAKKRDANARHRNRRRHRNRKR